MGRWQQSDGNWEVKSTWDLEGAESPVRVTNSKGTKTVAEFECNTVGKECAVEDAGRRSKVSMWFNEPKLVELETRGTEIVKRRFSITGDGDTMDLETIQLPRPAKSRQRISNAFLQQSRNNRMIPGC